MHPSTAAAAAKTISADGADAEVRDFQVRALEVRLQTMEEGRESQSRRAAIALETLADAYNQVYRYSDAARTYDDLTRNFSARSSAPAARDWLP